MCSPKDLQKDRSETAQKSVRKVLPGKIRHFTSNLGGV